MVLILTSVSSFSQTINFQFGWTRSKLDWQIAKYNQDEEFNNLEGFDDLLGIDYLDKKMFCLSSNFGYVQKGGTGPVVIDYLGYQLLGIDYKHTVRLNYITLNTGIKIKYTFAKLVTPYIFIAPRIDYLVKWKDRDVIESFKNDGKLNMLSYGAIGNAGINFEFDRVSIGFLYSYYYNFNDIVNFQPPGSGYPPTVINDHTMAFNLQFGYKL